MNNLQLIIHSDRRRERKLNKTKLLTATKVKKGNQLVHPNLIALSLSSLAPQLIVHYKLYIINYTFLILHY